MDDKRKGLAFWGVGVLIPVLIRAGGLPEGPLRDLGRLASWALFIAGACYYARAKGYRPWLGALLGLFHILGAFILIVLPRRSPASRTLSN